MQGKEIYLISHRGLAGYAPENTRSAFLGGYYLGFDQFETDVRITQDEQFVLFHDFGLERTSNGSGAVKEHTVSQLRELDCGGWFSPEFQGERILTLTEFFELLSTMKKLIHLVIHIKDEILSVTQIQRLLETIEQAQIRRTCNLNIASAHEAILRDVRRLAAGLPTTFLAPRGLATPESIERCKNIGCEFWAPYALDIDVKSVEKAHTENLKVRLWGMPKGNIKELVVTAGNVLDMGVDGLTTDFPDIVRTVCQLRNLKEKGFE
jgi:glycerophosphoryl diester phosphodiesterase